LNRFKRKKQEELYSSNRDLTFFEWAAGKKLFSNNINASERMQNFLVEIQKRCLAEMVLLLSWSTDSSDCQVLGISPSSEKSVISPELQLRLIRKCYEENKILVKENLYEDVSIQKLLKQFPISTLLIAPLHNDQDLIDMLLIVNYAGSGVPSRILDFIDFISSVLALSIQNTRLFNKLKRKDTELKEWTAHVEERISQGTKRLLEKEFQYQVLFEGAKDGIIVHNRDGRIIETNRVACRILGYEKDELLKMNWSQLAVSDYAKSEAVFFRKIANRERVKTFETILRKKRGLTFQAELSSQRVRFQGKESIQTFIRDISVRKALEESLRESKAKYRIFIESSMVGIFIIQKGIVQFVNNTFEKMTGHTKNELLDKNLFSLVDPLNRQMFMNRENRKEMGEEETDHYEVMFLKKDGGKFWGEVHSCRIILDEKPAILGNVIDITQRKQLESQLIETQKMESIGTLAGGIAHDFNNILGGILGYASLLLSDMSEDHPHYSDINAIAETTKRAADLTNQLLAFARGGKYQVTSNDMNQIVEEIKEMLANRVGASTVLETSLEQGLWPVLGDNRQIHQAILNICMNAVEAMPQGGKLLVKTEKVTLDEKFAQARLGVVPGDYIRVIIRDTGVGMDGQTKSRIFEPFFTTKPPGEGTGFGLAMVYGVVKNHDGAIWVDSKVGQGTVVTVYLPRLTKTKEVPLRTETVKSKESYRVLLVDDEEIIRQVARRMLENGGFEVSVAAHGKDAVEIYKKSQDDIDVVLLDVIMPKMGGKETYRRLKEINSGVRVIFTSGYGTQDRPELRNLNDTSFIKKPFQTEVLIQTVWNKLGVSNDLQKIKTPVENSLH